jgi:hypothetical protein
MATKHQKIKLYFPEPIPDKSLRDEIADLAIEKIVERTDKGLDKNGVPFTKYSKAYMNSLDFKNAGKSKRPNLQLSGDMLASIEVLDSTRNWVEIGFEKGSEENGKADGNIRGTYGKPTPVGPKRDFLGIKDSDLLRIIKYVKGD